VDAALSKNWFIKVITKFIFVDIDDCSSVIAQYVKCMAWKLQVFRVLREFMRNHKRVNVFILLCGFALVASACCSCSLALHEWKLVFHKSFELSSPILPLTEIDIPVRRIAHSSNNVFWIAEREWYNYLQVAVFPIIYRVLSNNPELSGLFNDHASGLPAWALKPLAWPLRTQWTLLPKEVSVGEVAFKMSSDKDVPLIIGSDKNVARVAVFVDQNSNNDCFNIVIAQDGRVRAVHANSKSPWAQELNPRSYISMIFYRLPIPGRILSISVFPVNSGVIKVYEHEELVRKLLDSKLLLPRPTSDFDPESNKIPELPD